ncbi:MAG TPA: Hpt domain-containing protein [Paraburkholderia sp.]|nr:Hpt domain-containing protein [Paraburkholderia sp.]
MMSYVLISAEPSWGHTSGLDTMLGKLGLTRRLESASASAASGLVVVDWRGPHVNALATRGLSTCTGWRTRIAVVPSDRGMSVLGELRPHFDSVLTAPVDECALCEALAAHSFDAVSRSEHDQLGAKVLELACGDVPTAAHLLDLILDTNRSTVAAMRHAFGLAQWDALASAAHRVAGSARMLDCHGLTALLMRLEAAARDRQTALAGAVLAIVVVSLERLDASLQIAREESATQN